MEKSLSYNFSRFSRRRRRLAIKEVVWERTKIKFSFTKLCFSCCGFKTYWRYNLTVKICLCLCLHCLPYKLPITHRVEDVLSFLASLLSQPVIRCQLRIRVRQQHHLRNCLVSVFVIWEVVLFMMFMEKLGDWTIDIVWVYTNIQNKYFVFFNQFYRCCLFMADTRKIKIPKLADCIVW